MTDPAPDAYQKAITDGTPGLARLADAALRAAEANSANRLEGLTIAALFSRMAAEADRIEPAQGNSHVVHGEVMLMRERYDREHERVDQAAVAGACAMRAFTRAADMGNEAAAARLSQIAPGMVPGALVIAKDWESADGVVAQKGYDALLRSAASGDPVALIAIMGEAVEDRQSGILSPIEALAIIEQCGRLGAAAGHCQVAVHLCHALEARGMYEREHGRISEARYRQADRLIMMSVLARSGHPGADEALAQALTFAPMASVALAASGSPAILSALPSEGAA